jgi:MFS family permease
MKTHPTDRAGFWVCYYAALLTIWALVIGYWLHQAAVAVSFSWRLFSLAMLPVGLLVAWRDAGRFVKFWTFWRGRPRWRVLKIRVAGRTALTTFLTGPIYTSRCRACGVDTKTLIGDMRPFGIPNCPGCGGKQDWIHVGKATRDGMLRYFDGRTEEQPLVTHARQEVTVDQKESAE